jgi:hypothetical protein
MVHNCKERSPSPFYRIGEQPSNIGYSTHSKIQDYEPTSQAYVVVSHPINHVHDIFSRAARVCLATSEADFDSGNITNGSLRTKLSWQSTTRRPEIEFYQEAITRSPIEQLAKIIAGGYFISTLQKDGRLIQGEMLVADSKARVTLYRHYQLNRPLTRVTPNISNRDTRWRNIATPCASCGGFFSKTAASFFVSLWILWSLCRLSAMHLRVRITSVIDSQLTVLLVAYHTLAEKRTLYRDISDSNVLVDGRRWKWTSHRP